MPNNPIQNPTGYAISRAVAYSDVDGTSIVVGAAAPLPVTTILPASAPLTGTAATSAQVGPFQPVAGRPVMLALSGSWSGTVKVLRSTDGGATKLPLTIAGASWGQLLRSDLGGKRSCGAAISRHRADCGFRLLSARSMSVDPIARGMAAKARSDTAKSANTQALIAAIRTYGSYPRLATALAATDIPVLTVGLASAVSSINGAAARTATVARGDAKLTYVSGVPRLYGPAFPRNSYFTSRGAYYGASDGVGTPLLGTGYFGYEFMHVGTVFEIPLAGAGWSGVNFRVLVNGAAAASTSVTSNTDGAYFVRVEFSASGTRRIRIETGGLPANGVHVANANEVASVNRSYPTLTLIGDSFVEGSGASVGDLEAIIMGRALGCNCALGGVGGTGLILTGGNNSAGFPKTNFTEPNRLLDLTLAGVTSAQDASAADPRLGVVFGSVNDQGLLAASYSAYGATLQDAITNRANVMVDAWLAARPGRPLVLFGPTWPSGPPNNRPTLDIYRIRDGIAEAAWSRAADNVWFIDRAMPHKREGIYSTINDQAFLYTGGLTGTDPTHPTPAGHRFDGLHDANLLRRLILSEFA